MTRLRLPLGMAHALRALRRSPHFVAVAVLSIGLGVGASTTVFSWMNSLVLNPFPVVADPDRLVGLEVRTPEGRGTPLSFPVYRDWRDAARSLDGVAAWALVRVSARERAVPSSAPLIVAVVSGNYFDVLGVGATMGRPLTADDERTAAPVAVLGHAYWLRAHGGDRSVIGETVFLNGQPTSIVGVAPERFAGTYVGVVPDVFVPITVAPRLTPANGLDDRAARWVQSVARLASGVTVEQAGGELDALARRISAASGERPAMGAIVTEARMRYLGRLVLPIFTAMLAVTTLLLLVACANVAALMLVRGDTRRQEVAVRLALGASRLRIAASAVGESALLAAGGGVVGVLAAFFARDLLYRLVPTGPFPITLPIPLDVRVLIFAAGSALVVTIACALAPALAAMRVAPGVSLRAGSRAVARSASRVRLGLVAAQIAFSLLCLTTAAVFVRGLRTAVSIDVGFSDPDRVLLVNTDFAAARLADSAGVAALDALLRDLRALPSVRAATVATMVPLGFGARRTANVRVDGHVPTLDESMAVERAVVGPDYAATMGIRVVAGRDIRDDDRAGALPVALVNEAFARRFWPDGSALGRRIDAGRGWATVVGVLPDGKYGSLTEPPQPVAYFAIRQWFQPSMTVHLRTAGDPRSLVEPVRDAMSRLHVDLPVLQPRTLAEHASAATFVPRLGASVLAVFALAGLALAVVGVHGALSFVVSSSSRELGIRLALGARAQAIAWAVLRQTVAVAAAGFLVGGALALAAGRVVARGVSGVDPPDVTSFAAAAALMAASVAAATILPVRRALGTDPALVLRNE